MHNIATSRPPVVGQDRALSPITTAVLALAELQMHCCGGVCGYCISRPGSAVWLWIAAGLWFDGLWLLAIPPADASSAQLWLVMTSARPLRRERTHDAAAAGCEQCCHVLCCAGPSGGIGRAV